MSAEVVFNPFVSTDTLLGVLFIGLKLGGFIDWSWLWVLSPFWLPLVFLFSVIGLGLITAVIVAAFKK